MAGDPGANETVGRASDFPQDPDGPVFDEPWEAQAFAMVLALRARGVIASGEWSDALGRELAAARAEGDPDTGESHYLHWLHALERLVTEKRLASRESLDRCREAWARAAARTAHGEPIELVPEDFSESPW
ncbi:MAG: nitrile hydratase accessory protein [Acidimicrobiales bacterium]